MSINGIERRPVRGGASIFDMVVVAGFDDLSQLPAPEQTR
jgi:hypothetical protein